MGKTTKPGFKNGNGQVNLGRTEPPRPGNDHLQFVYVMHCPRCVRNYGANGSGIRHAKCPFHQNGEPGLELTADEPDRRP